MDHQVLDNPGIGAIILISGLRRAPGNPGDDLPADLRIGFGHERPQVRGLENGHGPVNKSMAD